MVGWSSGVGWWGGVGGSSPCLAWAPVTPLCPATPSAGMLVNERWVASGQRGLWSFGSARQRSLFHSTTPRSRERISRTLPPGPMLMAQPTMRCPSPQTMMKQQPSVVMGQPQVTRDPTARGEDDESDAESEIERGARRRSSTDALLAMCISNWTHARTVTSWRS